MKRTTEAIERDLAARIKHSNDLRREGEELHRSTAAPAKKAARLKDVAAKRKRRKKS